MPTQTNDTLIIGGGLSGLYAAYLLSQKNLPSVILEARDRMGGRILTAEHLGFFPDLGPSWYWPEINPKLMHLIQTLGLRGHQQFEQGMGRFETAHGLVQTVRGYATQYDQPPHEHPLYQPPAGQTAIWDGMIQLAGSETANQYGDYLEGALGSAQRAVANI